MKTPGRFSQEFTSIWTHGIIKTTKKNVGDIMDQGMKPFKYRDFLITGGVLVTATVISFLFFYFVPMNSANIVLIYILALVLIARYTSGYRFGVFSSVVGVVFVNFFFTYPYFKINFTLSGYPVTFICMLSISLVTSTTTTRLKKQAVMIAERERALAEADKEKIRANLLRAVSHDLRTPLTSIIGSSASFLENKDHLSDNEKAELVSHIHDDSNWLLNMVENLLSVTRIKNDSSKVKKSPEVVEEVVSEAVLRLKKRLPDANIQVSVPDEVIIIPMDALLIEQVLINLLENAVVHSGSVKPARLSITDHGSCVKFKVRDYGRGISEDRIPYLFDGLGSVSGTDSHKGIGIGLSICKTIIQAHDGDIVGENCEDGAEFIFTLPKEE